MLNQAALEKAALALLRHDENTAPDVDWWAERRMRLSEWNEAVSYAIEGYREAQTIMSIEELDALDLEKLTEDQVVEAFRKMLRTEVRFMERDGNTDFCSETDEECEERTDARYILETMQLNYVASHVR